MGMSGLSAILEMPLHYIYVALPIGVALTFLNRVETFRVTLLELVQLAREEKGRSDGYPDGSEPQGGQES